MPVGARHRRGAGRRSRSSAAAGRTRVRGRQHDLVCCSTFEKSHLSFIDESVSSSNRLRGALVGQLQRQPDPRPAARPPTCGAPTGPRGQGLVERTEPVATGPQQEYGRFMVTGPSRALDLGRAPHNWRCCRGRQRENRGHRSLHCQGRGAGPRGRRPSTASHWRTYTYVPTSRFSQSPRMPARGGGWTNPIAVLRTSSR